MMGVSIMGSGRMGVSMGREYLGGQMEGNMMGNSSMIRYRGTGLRLGLMGDSIMDSLRIIYSMVQEQ